MGFYLYTENLFEEYRKSEEIVKFCGQSRSNGPHGKPALLMPKNGKEALFLKLMPKCL